MSFELSEIEQCVLGVLIRHAMKSETTNYEAIATEVGQGLPTQGSQLSQAISPLLENVYFWCEEHKLPRLTSIVVRKSGADQGLPGKGFWELFAPNEHFNYTREQKRELLASMHAHIFDYWSTGRETRSLSSAIVLLHEIREPALARIAAIVGNDVESYNVRNMLIRFIHPSPRNEHLEPDVDLRAVGIALDAAHTWIASLDDCQRSAIAAGKLGGCVTDQVISFWGWY